MVHLANFSDRQYVCQLWDLTLKEVGLLQGARVGALGREAGYGTRGVGGSVCFGWSCAGYGASGSTSALPSRPHRRQWLSAGLGAKRGRLPSTAVQPASSAP